MEQILHESLRFEPSPTHMSSGSEDELRMIDSNFLPGPQADSAAAVSHDPHGREVPGQAETTAATEQQQIRRVVRTLHAYSHLA